MEPELRLYVVLGIVLVGLIAIVLYLGSKLDKLLESYATEKGKNLAMKEDLTSITRTVEEVKAEISLLARSREALNVKQRETIAEIAEFVSACTSTPANAPVEELHALEGKYYKLLTWVPSEMVDQLTRLMPPMADRPDVKDLVMLARKLIIGDKVGPLQRKDVLHLTDRAREP